MKIADLEEIKRIAKKIAAARMAKYPQYKGHFDNYELCEIKRDIVTKMGKAFTKGEYVLFTTVEAEGTPCSPGWLRAWSMDNDVDTVIRASWIKVLTKAISKEVR